MPNLDIYLQDNGLLEYSRDLALTQYSNDYKIRLLTKKKFFVVNMNATTGTGIDTHKKTLYLNPIRELDGRYAYEYIPNDTALTGYEFGGDKSTIKIAFYLYPEENDLNKVITTSMVYIPLIKSLEDKPFTVVTENEYTALTQRLNDLYDTLEALGAGETESAKRYNVNYTGANSIAVKFNELEALAQTAKDKAALALEALDSVDLTGEDTLGDKIQQFEDLQNELQDTISDLDGRLAVLDQKLVEANALSDQIDSIQNAVNSGLKYRLVESLDINDVPMVDRVNNPGTIYIVRDNYGQDGQEFEDNTFTEYMWINNHWEKIGVSKSELNLTPYELTTEVDRKLNNLEASLTELINSTSSSSTAVLQNLRNAIDAINEIIPTLAPRATTLSGYGITNAYTKAEVDQAIQSGDNSIRGQFNNALNNLQTNIESQFAEKARDIDEVEALALEAKSIATAKVYAKTFETKSEMLAWIRHKPGSKDIDPITGETIEYEVLTPGTDIYIKENDVSDYWVAAVTAEASEKESSKGEIFYGSYYALEPIEINLEHYYTKDETYSQEQVNTIIERVDSDIAEKEALENKSTVIPTETTFDNIKYPTLGAVKTYVENEIDENNREYVAAYYETKQDAQDFKDQTEGDLWGTDGRPENPPAESFDERINDNLSEINRLDSSLANEITRATGRENEIEARVAAEEQIRAEEDERILGEAKDYADTAIDTLTDKLEDGRVTPYWAGGVDDYVNEQRIRFTTDIPATVINGKSNVSLEISEIQQAAVLNLIKWFAPNDTNEESEEPLFEDNNY